MTKVATLNDGALVVLKVRGCERHCLEARALPHMDRIIERQNFHSSNQDTCFPEVELSQTAESLEPKDITSNEKTTYLFNIIRVKRTYSPFSLIHLSDIIRPGRNVPRNPFSRYLCSRSEMHSFTGLSGGFESIGLHMLVLFRFSKRSIQAKLP